MQDPYLSFRKIRSQTAQSGGAHLPVRGTEDGLDPNGSAFDINKLEGRTLTKDRERQLEYYNYKIKRYTGELSELQIQMTTVQDALDSYEKDPVVIVSTQEITQTNGCYDTLVQRKLELSCRTAGINTELNRTYEQLNEVTGSMRQNIQEEYDRADGIRMDLAVHLSFGRLYHALKIRTYRTEELVFSQMLTFGIVDLCLYLECCLAHRGMVDILLSACLQLLFSPHAGDRGGNRAGGRRPGVL